MARTGSHLKIKSMGDAALGVRLEGDPQKPEPIHFRVQFPGGDIDIVRTADNEYWIHLRVENGTISDARLDIHGKPASETDVGDFNDPGLYHVALRVKETP